MSMWPWYNWLILIAIIGLAAFFFAFRKRQEAKANQGRPQQRGIIK